MSDRPIGGVFKARGIITTLNWTIPIDLTSFGLRESLTLILHLYTERKCVSVCGLWRGGWGGANTRDCMQNCWLFERKRSLGGRFLVLFYVFESETKPNLTFYKLETFRLLPLIEPGLPMRNQILPLFRNYPVIWQKLSSSRWKTRVRS